MQSKPTRTITISLALCALLVTAYIPALVHTAAASTTSSPGLIIPLYSYPGNSEWYSVLQEHQAYPNVPITVVINPAGGPGSYDPNYAYWISELQSAGINVLGYVTSAYGSVPTSTIESQMASYASMYGVAGIFIDQMSNVPGYESYYSTLTSYAHSDGLWLVVGNPGTSVPASFVGTVDVIIVWENSYLPSQSWMQSSTFGDSPAGFGVLAYGSTLDSSTFDMLAQYASYIYVSDGVWPYPYQNVPSYFTSELSYASAFAPSSSFASGPTYTINVSSQNTYGSAISGMYLTIYYNGNAVASGFTPFTYTGPAGSGYTVCIDNYQNYVFNNWQDGTTNPCYSFTLSSDYWPAATYTT